MKINNFIFCMCAMLTTDSALSMQASKFPLLRTEKKVINLRHLPMSMAHNNNYPSIVFCNTESGSTNTIDLTTLRSQEFMNIGAGNYFHAINCDQTILACRNYDSINIYYRDTKTNNFLESDNNYPLYYPTFSPVDKKLLTTYCDITKSILLWNAIARKLIKTIKLPTKSPKMGYLVDLRFSKDGTWMVQHYSDTTCIALIDSNSTKTDILSHDHIVRSFNFITDAKKLITATTKNELHIWDLEKKSKQSKIVLKYRIDEIICLKNTLLIAHSKMMALYDQSIEHYPTPLFVINNEKSPLKNYLATYETPYQIIIGSFRPFSHFTSYKIPTSIISLYRILHNHNRDPHFIHKLWYFCLNKIQTDISFLFA